MLMGTIAVLSAIFSVLICFGANGFGTLAWLWILPVSFVGLFLGLAILAFLALWGLTAIVDMNKPQDTDSKFYRWLTYLYIDAVFVILQTRFHTTGLENVPKDGRFLLVCNHLNDLDPLSLLKHFKKSQLAFISKRENDEKFIVGKLMHKILCQPINRENDREALKTIVKCIQILKDDKASIAVFPEGGTNKTSDPLLPYRSGVFKIAQKANVPIVVCSLVNSRAILHNMFRKHTEVWLDVLDVVPAEELDGKTAIEVGERVHAVMEAGIVARETEQGLRA